MLVMVTAGCTIPILHPWHGKATRTIGTRSIMPARLACSPQQHIYTSNSLVICPRAILEVIRRLINVVATTECNEYSIIASIVSTSFLCIILGDI